MSTSLLSVDYFSNDQAFDSLFPQKVQDLSALHWTPLEVATKASAFLASGRETKVLDIGSGVGKFCLVGAKTTPHAQFYGIEQRADLVEQALVAKRKLHINNTHFLHGNIMDHDLKRYDSFYFYNAFGENLRKNASIDNHVPLSISRYLQYTIYLRDVLINKPIGTRLVTFHALKVVVPTNYKIVSSYLEDTLMMWVKSD
ncbi:methyltransferase domain-containing protein [Olivibacter sp. CPCC 100613]|uniref:methyltransferase domain-containing protein n=1 Tax=Olivibacter sp. CPCC 100613 TaxID=3079931 RepID=UPI002FFD35CD